MKDPLWLPKTLFVLTTVAGAAWGRYAVVWRNRMGLDPSTNGLIRAVGLLTKFLAYPVWGYVSDRLGVKVALLVSIVTNTAVMELFRWPWVFEQLIVLAVVQTLKSVLNGVYPLVDAFSLAALAEQKLAVADAYGGQRLYCSIAWGVSGVLIGMLIDATDLSAIFPVTYILVALEVAVIAYFVPKGIGVSHSLKGDFVIGSLSAMKEIVTVRPLVTLFAVACVQGIVMTVPESVLFLWLERDMKASRSFTGWAIGISVVLEIPVFLYSKNLLRAYSHKTLILLSQVTILLRLLGYLMVVESANALWIVILCQASHGICFACYWVSAVSLNSAFAPPHLTATAHSLFVSVYSVLGASLGSILWMYLYQSYGAWRVFFLSAALMAACMLVLTPLLRNAEVPLPSNAAE